MLKFHMVIICVCVNLLLPLSGAQAVNWLMLQGTEKPGAPGIKLDGFLMMDYQDAGGDSLVAGPFSGQDLAKGQLGPGLHSSATLNLRKLQLGMHGAISDSWAYSIRAITGNNIATRGEHDNAVLLAEASMTWTLLPWMRVRVGRFKAPGPEEALAFAPPGHYINLTNVTGMLVQERFFPADGTDPSDSNDYTICSCCRDSGIMLFDALKFGAWELTYAAMLAQGYGLGYSDPNPNPELYLYLAAERLFGVGRRMWRQGWKVFCWSQHGQRTLDLGAERLSSDFTRERYGVGTTVLWRRWRLEAEFMYADGMIYMGGSGGAVPGTVSNNGLMVASYNVFPQDHAYGWYVDGAYALIPGLWGNVRYDVVRFGTDTIAERELESLTLGLEYFLTNALELKVNYEFRRGEARRQPSDSMTNLNMDEISDRYGVQLVWRF